MNNQKILYALLATLLLFITSCSKSTDLSDAIPSDATYIVHMDNKTLIEKSQYNIFENSKIQQGINIYKAFLNDKDKANLLDEFLKDPNSLGLDVKKDLYFYTNYKTYGIILGVNNADKLKNALLKFLPITEEDILKDGDTYTFSPESMVTATWDKNKFILLVDMSAVYYSGKNREPLDLKQQAVAQLKQKSDKSINSVKSFADFLKNKKDISVFYNMDGIEAIFEMAGANSGVEMDKLMPMAQVAAEFKGVSVGIYTSFEMGDIKFSGEYYYDSADTEKRFKELMSGMTNKIDGNHLRYITQEPLLMMAFSMNGEGLYQYLARLGFIKLINEQVSGIVASEQIEQLIKSVNGDFTFALSNVREETVKMDMADNDFFFEEGISQTIPEIIVLAEVKDPAFIKSFILERMNDGNVSYKEIAPGAFLIEEANTKIYLGVNNNTFFATNMESVYNNLGSSDLKNNYSDRINNKIMFMSGNLQPLIPYLAENRNASMFTGFLEEMGQYEMTTSKDDFSVKGNLEFKTKDKNSLAVICQQIDNMISNVRTPMGF